jgi:serine/threonine-protein kinase SRK2
VQYQVPPQLRISLECQDLLARIFVADPRLRISMEGIKQHPWFLKNLPAELANPSSLPQRPEPQQSVAVIQELMAAARVVPARPRGDAFESAMQEVEAEEEGEGEFEDAQGGYMQQDHLPC